jgi:hypothetical protein
MTLFDTKMTHFESMRTVMIHLDKFKDQNDKTHEYEDQHDTPTQVYGPVIHLTHSEILSNLFCQNFKTIKVMDFCRDQF